MPTCRVQERPHREKPTCILFVPEVVCNKLIYPGYMQEGVALSLIRMFDVLYLQRTLTMPDFQRVEDVRINLSSNKLTIKHYCEMVQPLVRSQRTCGRAETKTGGASR